MERQLGGKVRGRRQKKINLERGKLVKLDGILHCLLSFEENRLFLGRVDSSDLHNQAKLEGERSRVVGSSKNKLGLQ